MNKPLVPSLSRYFKRSGLYLLARDHLTTNRQVSEPQPWHYVLGLGRGSSMYYHLSCYHRFRLLIEIPLMFPFRGGVRCFRMFPLLIGRTPLFIMPWALLLTHVTYMSHHSRSTSLLSSRWIMTTTRSLRKNHRCYMLLPVYFLLCWCQYSEVSYSSFPQTPRFKISGISSRSQMASCWGLPLIEGCIWVPHPPWSWFRFRRRTYSIRNDLWPLRSPGQISDIDRTTGMDLHRSSVTFHFN